jgi:hypothetical protein
MKNLLAILVLVLALVGGVVYAGDTESKDLKDPMNLQGKKWEVKIWKATNPRFAPLTINEIFEIKEITNKGKAKGAMTIIPVNDDGTPKQSPDKNPFTEKVEKTSDGFPRISFYNSHGFSFEASQPADGTMNIHGDAGDMLLELVN